MNEEKSELQWAMFGMGCFWGVERLFGMKPGVGSTRVGYAGGKSPNPSYAEVSTGSTGHVEVVQLRYDPAIVSYAELLKLFWQSHDPTQGERQGNDIGSQYRSMIYVYSAQQLASALASKHAFQKALNAAGFGSITTEIHEAPEFYPAEAYHQRYLEKNPNGYCGLRGLGIDCMDWE